MNCKVRSGNKRTFRRIRALVTRSRSVCLLRVHVADALKKEVVMEDRKLMLPDIALIASTRAILGVGIGLLISSKLNADQRRAVGWSLVGVGVVTTVPLVMKLFGRD